MENLYDELDWAIDWVSSLATPERPNPSAWTDVTWCNHWREQRLRVIHTLERAITSGCAEEASE